MGIGRLPYYDGSYAGYTARVEGSVHKDLCPGDYEVPFTVTDADGNSDKATVTLTSSGIVRGPVVMSPYQIWDPDGDEVSVEVPGGEAPVHAANLSAFLGSLGMMYWPDAADEYCRAVREEDVTVDEFTVTLRDACGAETEVPVTVVIRVEDKAPPTTFPLRRASGGSATGRATAGPASGTTAFSAPSCLEGDEVEPPRPHEGGGG